jgi:type I restriction enzyme S subunit
MRVKLEDVCERGSSNLKQSDIAKASGDYPIYGASGHIGYVDFYHQEKPYVAIVKDGAGIGRTTLHPAKSSVIGTMQYLLPKDNVLPEYLCYVVRYMHLEKYFTGATIPHIYFKDYKNEQFNTDPLEKQAEIIEVLGKCEKVIEARQDELWRLDELIKARFVELFCDPVQNPYGWKKKRFDEICENLDSRRKPITSSDRVEGIYPYYGASGIIDYVEDYIFDEDILLVSEDGASLLMRSTPIAFSVSGKFWVNNHAHVVRFDKMCLQKCIEIFFSLIDISDSITGSAQPKLNQTKLNAMEFPIPDEDRLEEYLVFLNYIDKSKFV